MAAAPGKKKTKGEKMSLNEFLGGQSGSSWADDVDDVPGTSGGGGYTRGDAPRESARPIGLPDRGADRYGDDRYGDRASRYPVSERPVGGGSDDQWRSRGPPPDRGYPPRSMERGPERERRPYSDSGPKPVPDRPPYTAFIGNLPFDTSEQDLEAFFDPLVLSNIRVVRDPDGRPKGFGYVEFADREGLEQALTGDGSQYRGRSIRIDVAEPKDRDFGRSGSQGGEDKTVGDWRSTARPQPLPPVRREGSGRDAYGFGSREFGSRDSFRDSGRYGAGPREVEAPKERKRLELKPRSAVEPSAAEQSPRSEGEPAQPKKKVDPFGGARPVDVTSIEKKVEEKLQQKQAEEKQRLEELRAKKAAEAEEAKAGDRFVRRGDGKEAASSKSDAVDSWRAGPKAEGDAKRPAAGSAWGKDRKRSESSSATPKSPTDNKSVDELVPKVNAFNLLTDEDASAGAE